MNFPTWNYFPLDDILEAQKIIGIEHVLETYNTDRKWKIIVIESLEKLKSLEPNFLRMKGTEYGNIAVTCKGDEKYDYYIRCFVTDCGINEDPVTGSIECVLAKLWASKL
jgi:predicted PhzF superfamily epimerase YddE/YHI9